MTDLNSMLTQVAFGQLVTLLKTGMPNVHQSSIVPNAIPSASIQREPAADVSFDGIVPSVKDFLTLLDEKDRGQRDLIKYIPSLERLGFLFIDDLVHAKDLEKTFKDECDMAVGTTGFIIRKCQKELKRLGAI
jgi:hypothetical protein